MEIAAQVFGILAFIVSVTSFQLKTYRQILYAQTLCAVLFVIHFLLLARSEHADAMTGAALNGVCAVRDVVLLLTGKQRTEKMTSMLAVIFSVMVAVIGILTWSSPVSLLFIIAMVLNQKFRGRKIARAIVVFPWATSLVIQASVWNYIIKYEYGNLNNVLLNLGIIKQAINWRSSYQIEFVWECWVGIFVTIPFVTFCVLSGLQSIDGSLYEAATVDGAGFWDKLWRITIPLVRPSLTVSTVLNIIYVFNSFPIVYTMTKGAPANKTDTLITYLYMLNFYDRRKGPATALSVIGFVILCICAGIYMLTVMRKEED